MVLVIAGTFCLIYFLILRIVTKKWDSTFAVFWLAAGIISLGLRVVAVNHPDWYQDVKWGFLFIPAAAFLFVECLVFIHMRPQEVENLPYIIVLGAQIQGTKITDSLVRRLDRACRYLKSNPDTKVIVAGGRGKGEDITEASAMKGFLIVQGIAGQRIFAEDTSATTKENLKNSSVFLPDKDMPVGIVTNNFHMYRAVKIGKRQGYKKIYRIPADCSYILFLNYAVREFFAVCKMWIFR